MVGVTLFGTSAMKKTGNAQAKTVLETGLVGTPTPNAEDDFGLWDESQMIRSEANQPFYRWGKSAWCRPSCIPISVILLLIVLVVLLPLLDHHPSAHGARSSAVCSQTCRIRLVESIPQGLDYPSGSPSFMSTYDAWQGLINASTSSIDIGALYWTLRSDEVANHSSSAQGEQIFQSLLRYGRRGGGRKLRIAQNQPSRDNPNVDTIILAKKGGAEVRSVNFPKLIGAGVLHTKVWVVDGQHVYLGSANMDWRSLTQVKELGVLIENCSCLAQDISKVFSVYWQMGADDARIPSKWPESLSTKINANTPIKVNYSSDHAANVYISSSPAEMNPKGRTHDLQAIKKTISKAEKFVYISVMDYFPTFLYQPHNTFWPEIDNAIRSAAIDNNVHVRMLISWWNHSRPAEDYYLRSLQDLSGAGKNVNVEVKRFIVPTFPDQVNIPFARVNHNKYMVTDKTAYIGTSNWSADYFTNTAGIALVVEDVCDQHLDDCHGDRNSTSIRAQLESIFMRDWNSPYAVPLNPRS